MKNSDAVNRDQIRARLAASRRGLEQTGEADHKRTSVVLGRRAERLRRRTGEEPAGRMASVIVFSLGSVPHAVELKYVIEVLALSPCSRVPGTPPHFLGAINVRGEFRAVLDLGRLLGLPEGPGSSSGYVLMLRHQGQSIGWKVDGVAQVREIDLAEMAPAGEGRYVKGLTSGALLLVDAQKILADVFAADGFPNKGVVIG